jgi:hypothetical protein
MKRALVFAILLGVTWVLSVGCGGNQKAVSPSVVQPTPKEGPTGAGAGGNPQKGKGGVEPPTGATPPPK